MNEADKLGLALSIVTGAMAIATGFLALFTYKLAKATADGINQAQKHHQQNLRPFCVIDFAGADYRVFPFGVDFDPASRRTKSAVSGSGTNLGNNIFVRGELKNKGAGLAKDVVIYLNTRRGVGESGAFRLTRPVVVAGLVGAGETASIDITITASDTMKDWIGGEWKEVQGIEFIPNDTCEVVLEYKDVFENIFRTVHPRKIWHDTLSDTALIYQKEKQNEMLLRPNAPMPLFLSDRQSMRTMADAPQLPQTPEPLQGD